MKEPRWLTSGPDDDPDIQKCSICGDYDYLDQWGHCPYCAYKESKKIIIVKGLKCQKHGKQ